MKKINLKSYAKINLFLIVKKKKQNDLHKIKSVFKLHKEIYDDIFISLNKKKDIIKYIDTLGKKITVNNCIIKKTLIFLRKYYNIKNHYKIIIKKNIPIGSGLGGASSNAAALIKSIIKMENINQKIKNLHLIGSDVPFFYSGYEYALVKGYGQKVKKIKLKNIHYDLKLINQSCSTRKVYDEYDKIIKEYGYKRKSYLMQLFYLKISNYKKLVNDLEKPCFLLYKRMYNIKNSLNEKFYPLLSGSGSTLILFKK